MTAPQLQLFGVPAWDGRPLPPERRTRLLAVLALARDGVPRERLAQLFWPGREDGPAGLRWRPPSDHAAGCDAVAAADWPRAAACVHGPLLAGVEAGNTRPAFDAWRHHARADWTAVGDFAAINARGFAIAGTGSGLLLAAPPSPPPDVVTVQRPDDGTWQTFGASQGVSSAIAGVPLLSRSQATTTRREFHLRRWTGADWYPRGDPLPPLGRSANGTNLRVAVAGGTVPVAATEVVQGAPNSDHTLRVQALR